MSTVVRPVFCVTEHEHRDLAVAEAVASGRFTLQGKTRLLGVEPDWLGADLPADEEWRLEWVKFYYGLDLAYAQAVTGEERFREAWERLVGSWISRVPPDADASEVAARRIQNWIYAWQRLPDVSGGLAGPLADSIAAQARHVRDNLAPERNHRTLELYALLVVALALPEAAGDLLPFAVAELDRNLAADFQPDGVHREASTHYHMVALRSFVGMRENARRHGLALPDGFDERLSRACDFALHCRRPDGTIPALSDADSGHYGSLLALAGELLDRDDLRGRGSAAAHDAGFPDGGYFVQRSGWEPDARFAIFDCGPLGDGGHGHYDALSIEAWGGGRPLVVDPGRFTYSEAPPNLRRWFRGTAAHNTVCVDRLDQTPYARGRSAAPAATARFLGRTTAPGLDVLAGEVVSPVYDAVHRRRVIFVDGAYWLIEDRLTGERPHRYDLRFHLAPGVARLQGAVAVAPGVAIAVAGADALAIEAGWVSPAYGVKHAAPVLSASVRGVCDATFVTLLTPLAPGAEPPAFTCEWGDPPVVRVGGRDTLVLREDAVELVGDGVAGVAR